jgi:deferrochelatase/peroxidase EfeB
VAGLSDVAHSPETTDSPETTGASEPTRSPEPTAPPTGVSRRRLFGWAGAGALGVGAGVAAGFALGRETKPENDADQTGALPPTWPFYADRQAGITTPAQDRLHFAAFDMSPTASRDDLVSLLTAWTAAAAKMTQGEEAGEFGALSGPYDAPPDDTGEAIGLPAARLTVTIGFGPGLFRDATGRDRFGLADRQPAQLQPLPHFPADNLRPQLTGGDLCVQACADDPQVAVHAVRNLSRIAFGTASLRWAQLGFGRTSSTSTTQDTPRNLFGFKDGTANLKAEDTSRIDAEVFVHEGDDGRADWLAGGSYLVARKINMHIEPWDRTSLAEQEQIVGRDKRNGAPLSGGQEFTEPDFTATGRDDLPLIATNAHVRLANPSGHGGLKILRRGYNFTDGNDELGRLSAGLFFIAFVRDPAKQYIPLQTRLSRDDAMMEYLQHTGSGFFAVPPGVRPGGFVGETLLG